MRYGSVSAGFASLAGVGLVVDRPERDFGEASLGTSRDMFFRVWNRSSRPVRLAGASKTCDCTVAEGLPTTIRPGSSRFVKVAASAKKVGPFNESVQVYTDHPRHRTLTLRVRGTVTARAAIPSLASKENP